MKRIVIDASVAAKLYLPEQDSEVAHEIFEQDAEFHAPMFLKIEFASIFWKHSVAQFTSVDVWQVARKQLLKAIGHWHSDEELMDHAFEIALAHKHPIYDCLYISLAAKIDGIVVTADKQMVSWFRQTQFSKNVMLLAEAGI